MNRKLNDKKAHIEININITESLLTPLSCASLISEIIKGLLYQKNQIPYTFSWMKSNIEKKRSANAKNEENNQKRRNFQADNHYRLVSCAYDNIESILNSLQSEFKYDGHAIKEIVILFGITPLCPVEIFSINISSLTEGHIDSNHIPDMLKTQQKYLRSIFLSQDWMDTIDGSMKCTNTYVFIRKTTKLANNVEKGQYDSCFLKSKPLNLSSNIKRFTVNLNNKTDKENVEPLTCCSNLVIFNDETDSTNILGSVSTVNDFDKNNDEFEEQWYQSSCLIKGFKECYINKKSATELW